MLYPMLAGILLDRDKPLRDQPHRIKAIEEFLGYPTSDDELIEIVRTGKRRGGERITPLELAKAFHYEYERLAPSFGYETREETRQFDEESANGKLMIAVCASILDVMCK